MIGLWSSFSCVSVCCCFCRAGIIVLCLMLNHCLIFVDCVSEQHNMNYLLEIVAVFFLRHCDRKKSNTLARGRTELVFVILIRMFGFIGVHSHDSECAVTGGLCGWGGIWVDRGMLGMFDCRTWCFSPLWWRSCEWVLMVWIKTHIHKSAQSISLSA